MKDVTKERNGLYHLPFITFISFNSKDNLHDFNRQLLSSRFIISRDRSTCTQLKGTHGPNYCDTIEVGAVLSEMLFKDVDGRTDGWWTSVCSYRQLVMRLL